MLQGDQPLSRPGMGRAGAGGVALSCQAGRAKAAAMSRRVHVTRRSSKTKFSANAASTSATGRRRGEKRLPGKLLRAGREFTAGRYLFA